jgi:hypothetical protein
MPAVDGAWHILSNMYIEPEEIDEGDVHHAFIEKYGRDAIPYEGLAALGSSAFSNFFRGRPGISPEQFRLFVSFVYHLTPPDREYQQGLLFRTAIETCLNKLGLGTVMSETEILASQQSIDALADKGNMLKRMGGHAA